jgi:hypothetical protein
MEGRLVGECDKANDEKKSILSLWLDQQSPPPEDEPFETSSVLPQTGSSTLADLQALETCVCPGCLQSHIEPEPESFQWSRKRKRHLPGAEMDDSDSISVGSSSRIIANRPILEPTPPSTKRTTRTPSPTRKLLTMLEQARPPLKCCQPGNAVGTLPERVVALRRYLAKDLGKSCIPRDLEVCTLLILTLVMAVTNES